MTVTDELRQRWEAGAIDDDVLLLALCDEIAAAEAALAPLEDARSAARAFVSEVVERMGGKATVTGFGSLTITQPTQIVGYDTQAVNDLAKQLISEGHPDIALRIRQCEKRTQRAGSLRISREQHQLS